MDIELSLINMINSFQFAQNLFMRKLQDTLKICFMNFVFVKQNLNDLQVIFKSSYIEAKISHSCSNEGQYFNTFVYIL